MQRILKTKPLAWLGLLLAFTLIAAACNSSSSDTSEATTPTTAAPNETTTAAGVTTTAACDAFVAASQALDNGDLQTALASLKDFVAAVPNDVAADVEPLVSLLEEDPEAAFETEGADPGDTAADQYALENCGDTRVDIEAYNFAFVDVPPELEAGRVAFNMVNRTQTDEFHEAILLRQNDGVTETAHDQLSEILGAPISVEATFEALQQFSLVTVGFVAPEGGDTEDVFVADLKPGQYILVCMLPEHSSELLEAYLGGEEIVGERHNDLGMFAEFTVS